MKHTNLWLGTHRERESEAAQETPSTLIWRLKYRGWVTAGHNLTGWSRTRIITIIILRGHNLTGWSRTRIIIIILRGHNLTGWFRTRIITIIILRGHNLTGWSRTRIILIILRGHNLTGWSRTRIILIILRGHNLTGWFRTRIIIIILRGHNLTGWSRTRIIIIIIIRGRNSSLVVFGLAVHSASVAGSILLWGNFLVEGIFPLELTWVQTPLPKKLFRMRV